MPFGKKRDILNSYEIDFDRVYNLSIKPAAEAACIEVIRADEERSGGIIHVPMYERLLLAEIVIADLTLLNPNVFYELGVRHCAKPRSTFLIYAKDYQLPFDVHMIRAIPYDLEKGWLPDNEANRLKTELQKRLEDAATTTAGIDSPLFQLVQKFPGISIPHEVTETFRDRAKYIDTIREELYSARHVEDHKVATNKMKEIENGLSTFNLSHSELFVDLLLSYRDVNAYDEMISLVNRLPDEIKGIITVQEQYAFALNRRNGSGDRVTAVKILRGIIDDHGCSPETCGLLARVYKDLYIGAGDQKASAFLDEAITWYLRGFEADPRDYYPGINACTLMFVKGDKESLDRLLPSVVFAIARRGGIESQDYWDVAAALEAAVLAEDWVNATRALKRLLILDAPSWNRATTLNNLKLILDARLLAGLSNTDLIAVIDQLK